MLVISHLVLVFLDDNAWGSFFVPKSFPFMHQFTNSAYKLLNNEKNKYVKTLLQEKN
jgi:hypothetical protein